MPNIEQLSPELANSLDRARQKLAIQGINLDQFITSGFRTSERQAALYAARGSNPNPVARPGTSPHERGEAVDIAFARASPAVREAIEEALMKAGLYRPLGMRDPVHWQVRPGGVPVLPDASGYTGPLPSLDVQPGASSAPAEVGGAPEGEWVAMASTMLSGGMWTSSSSVGASEDEGELEVEYVKTGRRYSYYGVPRAVWRELVEAGSKGEFMRSAVIGVYPFA